MQLPNYSTPVQRENSSAIAYYHRLLQTFHDNIKFGKYHEVHEFIQQYPKIIELSNIFGQQALQIAVAAGQEEIVTLLLKHGSNINSQDYFGDTALHEAAYNGYTNIVRDLLRYGADAKIKNKYLSTALHDAVSGQNYDVSKLLIDHGANINAIDEDGNTPLMLAVEDANIASLLLAKLLGDSSDIDSSSFCPEGPAISCSGGSESSLIKEFMEIQHNQ